MAEPVDNNTWKTRCRAAQAERDDWIRDCRTLLTNLDWLIECTGEAPEDEDAVLVAQIRARLERASHG